MPNHDTLPTVTISVLSGQGVDISPCEVGRRQESLPLHPNQHHRFLRYDPSFRNLVALGDCGLAPTMTFTKARQRFMEGQRDGVTFLRSIGHGDVDFGRIFRFGAFK